MSRTNLLNALSASNRSNLSQLYSRSFERQKLTDASGPSFSISISRESAGARPRNCVVRSLTTSQAASRYSRILSLARTRNITSRPPPTRSLCRRREIFSSTALPPRRCSTRARSINLASRPTSFRSGRSIKTRPTNIQKPKWATASVRLSTRFLTNTTAGTQALSRKHARSPSKT